MRGTRRLLRKPLSVAVCSREPERDYQWLEEMIREKHFKKQVKRVHPLYITNNMSDLHQAISYYNFAILYHSKKRGRINVTNVTDSLYDDELKFLFEELGKKNVAVVIDDLDDSSDAEKERILKTQPDIREHACELFLSTAHDKGLHQIKRFKKILKKAKNLTKKKHGKKEEEKNNKKIRVNP